jgi:anti-sigma B factor antagonist
MQQPPVVLAPSPAAIAITLAGPSLVHVELFGRVDAASVISQREKLRALVAEGNTRFVVDLSRVDFLDSAGMAMLVSLMKQARQAGGDLRVVRPTDESVQRILHLTRLDLVLNMSDTAPAALASLRI